jgi:hypothetical protein
MTTKIPAKNEREEILILISLHLCPNTVMVFCNNIYNLDLNVILETKAFYSAPPLLLPHSQHVRTRPLVFSLVNLRIYFCLSAYLHQFIALFIPAHHFTYFIPSVHLYQFISTLVRNKTRVFILSH